MGSDDVEWRRDCLICGEGERRTTRPGPDDDLGPESDEAAATARDDAAEARDRRAETRDHVADVRDKEADSRDRDAHASDDSRWFDRRAAETTDSQRSGMPDHIAVLPERTADSWDRSEAVSDRSEAAGDRRASAEDRDAAARDRTAASFDELTGAHRRGPGFDELERELARARRTGQQLVLAFVDVNHLKTINDTHGHPAGDKVLRNVVATLRTKLRSYDLIIRFGGDEFLCAIPGVNLDQATERLRAVNTTLQTTSEHASVTIGYADLQTGDSLQDLIARADSALYQRRQQHNGPSERH